MPNHRAGIQWMTGPGEVSSAENLRIVRAPSRGRLEVMVLSHQVTGTYTHYMNGRTQPCFGQLCKGCEVALPTRWHGWVVVVDEESTDKMILELTEGPGDALARFYAEHRTLRGLRVQLTRPSGKPNGRVVLKRAEQVTNHSELPKCPDLQRVLLKIWGLDEKQGFSVVGDVPPPQQTVDGQQYIGRTVG